ncbi:hypothetical protein RFI_07592 [Reticulomyxa filosa]|uniref:Ion transport domain-containing protein n=1 Tax=Reticulomyxa filosa TaxID=46433 RepID=X6NTC2_RETFI|nr:hypothetical protein RFI_07592 [Reticulomyxa filosa]|eukprot:ETO29525.1 hypothetical protein RFI_07592 [Reticulomyxa filosa]
MNGGGGVVTNTNTRLWKDDQDKTDEHKKKTKDKDNDKDKEKDNEWNCCQTLSTQYTIWSSRNKCCIAFHRFRRWLRVNIVNTTLFDYFILCIIIANCVFIAMEQPKYPNAIRPRVQNTSDLVFVIIFTLEMVMKWLAFGLWDTQHNREGKGEESVSDNIDGSKRKVESKTPMSSAASLHSQYRHTSKCANTNGHGEEEENEDDEGGENEPMSKPTRQYQTSQEQEQQQQQQQEQQQQEQEYVGYFQNGWNILDFLIVVTSWLSLGMQGSHVTSVRMLRVLKPLRSARTVTKLRPLRMLIGTILRSFKSLADVSLLLLFLMITFAIVATQMFSGALHQQCFALPLAQLQHLDWKQNATLWLPDTYYCPNVHPVHKSHACPSAYPYCLDVAPNPNRYFFFFLKIFL